MDALGKEQHSHVVGDARYSPPTEAHLSPTYSCLFLDTFYEQFLADLYQGNPSLEGAPFDTQLACVLQTNN